jgi:hypothetical protein
VGEAPVHRPKRVAWVSGSRPIRIRLRR